MRRGISAAAMVVLATAACQDGTPVAGPEAAASVSPAALPQQSQDRFLPGELLVKVLDGQDDEAVAGTYGLTVEGHGPGNRFAIMRGAAGNEAALAARIGADARVEWAEPDYLRQPTTVDPRLWAFVNPGGLQITFTRGGQRGQPVTSYLSLADADVDNVEGYASGGGAVVIGSIDTGVDFTHAEFLTGQLIAGNDWYDNDADPTDGDGHGTHTTGTMVGRNVGVAGVSGAGPNVQVFVQRVCGPIGCPTTAIVNAIYAAADRPGLVAMNLSLGGSSESNAERDAIAYATSHDVLVIASAGNNGTSTVSCPACDPNAISVAALNWQDQLSYYSNWGSGLDLSAPGGEMYSNTSPESGILSSVPGGYAYYQGTSMAAPIVTGTAGIVASKLGLRGSALRSRLEGTADNVGSTNLFGHGRVNAYRAVMGTTLDESGSGGGSGGGGELTLTASFTYACNGASCSFDASGSTGATAWAWAFGDGATATGVTASHTYPTVDASYDVVLTVTGSGTATTTQSINCRKRGKTFRCS